MGCQVVPLFVVFHNPPEAEATYIQVDRLGTTAMAVTRPPILPGPRHRTGKASSSMLLGAEGSAAFDWKGRTKSEMQNAKNQRRKTIGRQKANTDFLWQLIGRLQFYQFL